MTTLRTVAAILSTLAFVTGCPAGKKGSGPGAPAAPTPTPVGATGNPAGSDGPLWQASADLDGDGTVEAITLASPDVKRDPGQHDEDPRINIPVTECQPPDPSSDRCRALLTVGGVSQELWFRSGYFGGVGAKIIDIDTSDTRKEILITRRGDSDEDPWYEFAVVLYDGSRVYYQELWHAGGYNSGTVAGDGKGMLTLHYDECPDSFTVFYLLEGTELVESARKTLRTANPDQCAACPHVYLLDGGAFVFQGEILRNLNRETLAARQSLSLAPVAADTVVTIELREEKDEITFLDEIHLDAGGVPIPPDECATTQAFCAADGAHHLLHRGETLRLTFSLGAHAAPLRLVATGHYLPQ